MKYIMMKGTMKNVQQALHKLSDAFGKNTKVSDVIDIVHETPELQQNLKAILRGEETA